MGLPDHNVSFTRITIYRACYVALCAGCGYVVVEMLGMPPLLATILVAFVGALVRGYAWDLATALFPLDGEDGQTQAQTEAQEKPQPPQGADSSRFGPYGTWSRYK
jgi:hypothetical protein